MTDDEVALREWLHGMKNHPIRGEIWKLANPMRALIARLEADVRAARVQAYRECEEIVLHKVDAYPSIAAKRRELEQADGP